MEYCCNFFELTGGKIMARCDMAGFATSGELSDLYFSLGMMSPEDEQAYKFALYDEAFTEVQKTPNLTQ